MNISCIAEQDTKGGSYVDPKLLYFLGMGSKVNLMLLRDSELQCKQNERRGGVRGSVMHSLSRNDDSPEITRGGMALAETSVSTP